MANEGIGKRIKEIRTELGLTMKEFGSILTPPASDSLVSRWEREINAPNRERMKEIAKYGDVTVDYLRNGKTTYVTFADDKVISLENLEEISKKLENELNERLNKLENGNISPFEGSIINNVLKIIEQASFDEIMKLISIFSQLADGKVRSSDDRDKEEVYNDIERQTQLYKSFLMEWKGYDD